MYICITKGCDFSVDKGYFCETYIYWINLNGVTRVRVKLILKYWTSVHWTNVAAQWLPVNFQCLYQCNYTIFIATSCHILHHDKEILPSDQQPITSLIITLMAIFSHLSFAFYLVECCTFFFQMVNQIHFILCLEPLTTWSTVLQ